MAGASLPARGWLNPIGSKHPTPEGAEAQVVLQLNRPVAAAPPGAVPGQPRLVVPVVRPAGAPQKRCAGPPRPAAPPPVGSPAFSHVSVGRPRHIGGLTATRGIRLNPAHVQGLSGNHHVSHHVGKF
eukprot:TRINITY_DN2128_c8_g1_i1.p4 TRINITY_DN2128_c8_g1~~TRINITY_DN2128_c8_g1_i1.p4  ORF type:complete len:127 (+),score=15.56 TRINITY_DN2128_c8_g1_i1:116-496(+)